MSLNRRQFVQHSAALVAGFALGAQEFAYGHDKKPWFEISLAEWSLHKALFGNKMTNLDFPIMAKKTIWYKRCRVCEPVFQRQSKGHYLLIRVIKTVQR